MAGVTDHLHHRLVVEVCCVLAIDGHDVVADLRPLRLCWKNSFVCVRHTHTKRGDFGRASDASNLERGEAAVYTRFVESEIRATQLLRTGPDGGAVHDALDANLAERGNHLHRVREAVFDAVERGREELEARG